MTDLAVTPPEDNEGVRGFLYQFHLSEPLGDPSRPRMSAEHYLGWAKDEDSRERRIEHHRKGTAGVAITKAAVDRGIELIVCWLGEGSRDDERRMKRAGHHDRRCSVCQERLQGNLEQTRMAS